MGSPEEVFSSPENQFVARFIGKPAMNFLQLKVITRDGRYFLENREFSYEISERYYERHLSRHLGRKVIVGIRPSSIELLIRNTPCATSKTNVATVSLIENMGNEDYVYLSLNSKTIITKTESDIGEIFWVDEAGWYGD